MTGMNDHRTYSASADSLARGVKGRMRLLLLAGMLTVALIFGVSFYFALLSNQSALARQIPELEEVASKLKSVLLVNTFAITAIIIVSFFLLATIVSARVFQPLALLHRDLLSLADGKLPKRAESREAGAFSSLETAWNDSLAFVREKEIGEIKELADCAAAIARNASKEEISKRLQGLADRKKSFVGIVDTHQELLPKEPQKDPLFIQPI
jgi:hypothetical protein